MVKTIKMRARFVKLMKLLMVVLVSTNGRADNVHSGEVENQDGVLLDFANSHLEVYESATDPNDSREPPSETNGAGLRFLPRDHEPRIYLAAPSGVFVTQVVAVNVMFPNLTPNYKLHSNVFPGNGHKYFQIDPDSGSISTKRYIDEPVGTKYDMFVVAHSRGDSIYSQITIHVTEYNSFPPVFDSSSYITELDILTEVGTRVLTVRALDRDTKSYNTDIYYSMQKRNNLLSINRKTGEIILKDRLSPRFRDVSFTILAQDGGSPQRTGRTKLVLRVKILSAPLWVSVKETSKNWAMFCWAKPRSGRPTGYLVYLTSTTNFDSVTRSVVRNASAQEIGKKEGQLCIGQADLQPWEGYQIRVAAWNKEEIGIASLPIYFNTRINRTCLIQNLTRYFCTCEPGFYGVDCSSFNPCVTSVNLCLNGGSCSSHQTSEFNCECLDGYYGTTCEHFNPCSRSPCRHGSLCINVTDTKYLCDCEIGFTGSRCETDIDDCEINVCKNNGRCVDARGSYSCICHPGFGGNNCEQDLDECLSSPCQNNGTCINKPAAFTCKCAKGFRGSLCQVDIDECSSYPCQNSGTCIDGAGKYTCKCPGGFTGLICETNINECSSNPCENNSTCIDGIDDYSCICMAGFEGDYCEEEVDECLPKPCLNGGSCSDGFNDYTCVCAVGFGGKSCEIDIDLCASNPCLNGGKCIDNTNHFTCECAGGYQGIMCNEKERCPKETIYSARGTFEWEPMEHGHVVSLACPFGNGIWNFTEKGIYRARTYFEWGSTMQVSRNILPEVQPNAHNYLKENKFRNNHERELLEAKLSFGENGTAYAVRSCLLQKNGSVKWTKMINDVCRDERSTLADELRLQLEDLTRDPSQMDVEMFINASKQVRQILEYALTDQQIAQSMISVISNMMDVNDTVLDEGDRNGSISQSLIHVVNMYTEDASIEENQKISMNSENLALETYEMTTEDMKILDGLLYTPIHLASHYGKHGEDYLESNYKVNENISINIPYEAIHRAARVSSSARIQFVSFKTSKFFRPLTLSNGSMARRKQQVITASISNFSVDNLTEALTYTLPNVYKNRKQMCVYWHPELQEWLDDGLTTNQTSDWIMCESTHMTAFSVLLDPNPDDVISLEHQQALSIISYIGSVCSVLGLLLTIITYSIFRCLNRDHSGKILLNLCISLLLMNVSFLMIAGKEYIRHIDICTSIAVLTHYFVLTSLTWMLVEAVNMYQLLVTVFATAETKFMLKRIICAWGLPLILVATSYLYDPASYNSDVSSYCLISPLHPYMYYLLYLGPACFILLINIVVFVLVSRVLFQRRTAAGKVGAAAHSGVSIAQVRGAFTVMTLLGVTWVFGSLAIGGMKLTFQYLFCISNSLQGFIIFVVRCVKYPEARIAWSTLLTSGELKKHRGTLPSSSNSRNTVTSSANTQLTRKGQL